MNHHGIETDDLAIGLTRSPMFMGVTVKSFFLNVLLCTLICVDAHTVLGIPLFVVIHLIMVRMSIKDPDFLYLHFKAFTKTPPVLNRWYWGKTNSYEPW